MDMAMQDEVRSFDDIIRLLEQQPALRERLRQLLLTQELLELPRTVAGLAEAVSRLEGQVERLAQAQERAEERLAAVETRLGALEGRVDRLEEAIARLAEAQARTEQRLEELAQAQARTEQRLEELAQAQERTEERLEELAGAVGDLRGWRLEEDVRRRPLRYLRRFIGSPRVLDDHEVLALAQGLPDEDVDFLLDADLIARGERGGQAVYVVAEVGLTARVYDVDRAADRAELLRRVVREPVLAAIIGERTRPAAVRRAQERQVWQLIDRRLWAPGEQPPTDLVADGPGHSPEAWREGDEARSP